MPVHATWTNLTSDSITLSSDGSIPLTIESPSGSGEQTFPWLTTSGVAGNATWFDTSSHAVNLTTHPLADNERLVALAGGGIADASALFPGATIVPVQLDPAQPLPGPIWAWESLDALLLDDNSAARIDQGQLRGLLAANTLVAIRSDRHPDGNWPWQRQGALWILRPRRAGPTDLIEPDAYGPTYTWDRGLPFADRRRALLSALVIAALLLAATLWQPRRALLPTAAVALFGSALWLLWQSRHPPRIELTGRVLVESNSLTQSDRWTWLASPVAGDLTFAVNDLTHPIFFSPRQREASAMNMAVNADGRSAEFRFHLLPQAAIAFLSETVSDQIDRQPMQRAGSALSSMAQSLYANQELSIAGEWTDDTPSTTVLLQAAPLKPTP